MNSYEVHGLRVSSTAVRAALAAGDMQDAAALLGRPYAISAMWCMGASWAASWASAAGRADGFRTLNLRFRATGSPPPAASSWCGAWPGRDPAARRGQPGRAPSLDPNDVNGGRVLLETHCLQWPAPGRRGGLR
jgi:riboflavin kinase/FMN adenylyltransferase